MKAVHVFEMRRQLFYFFANTLFAGRYNLKLKSDLIFQIQVVKRFIYEYSLVSITKKSDFLYDFLIQSD